MGLFQVLRVREFSVVNGNRRITKRANMTDESRKKSSICFNRCMKIIILERRSWDVGSINPEYHFNKR